MILTSPNGGPNARLTARRSVLAGAFAISSALGGCASAPPAPSVHAPMTMISTAIDGPVLETPSSGVCQPKARARRAPAARRTPPAVQRTPTPQAALSTANAQARRRPGADGFIDATHIYDFAPGAIFELYAAPEFLSTIELEEGETLQTTAAGDTARWMVESVPAAGAVDGRTIVLVKPLRAGVRTNIVLVTDRRTYLVEAIAVASGAAYSAKIAWRYPPDGVMRTAAGPVVALDGLNFRYTIATVRGRAPHWKPVRVFDDGRRTFIEFPLDIAAAEIPPLFVRDHGQSALVNYRVAGNRFIVDRLFDAAELRLGDRRPNIVRISREARR